MTIVFSPPCTKSPVRTRLTRPNDVTPADSKFIAARQINPFTDERIELTFPDEPIEVARYFDVVWDESKGGALPMTYQPADGRGSLEVRFAGRPTVTQTNLRTCTIQVTLEKRVI